MTPWLYQGNPFAPEYSEILIRGMFGFIYLITNLKNNRRYIGKKYFHAFRKKKKHESDWRTYYGSSVPLMNDVVSLRRGQFQT
jgi:Putative endonuclease segE, GIY-YIG domain